MLPLMCATPYVNYPQLNLQQFYMLPTSTYAMPIPMKETCDQACQFPEPIIEQDAVTNNMEIIAEQELTSLLRFLSKNISLLQDSVFEEFVQENLKTLSSFSKDIPNMIKKRYVQVNKTKEEMTKFIIRRCFLFIKSQIEYEEKEGMSAEERDRLFYHSFFSDDKEFMKNLNQESIDDMIPFRKDSKMKTMNETYLRKLFASERFSNFYTKFLQSFTEICNHENDEKIDNMTKQIIKIIITRDFAKIKSYRRFPWKDHEIIKCEQRAKEIYSKYSNYSKANTKNKFLSKLDSHTLDILEKFSESSE
ncbi:unnamed protein product [Paramecium pentaurelia]|uniref:Uncharacterized protein n=1 Tax=Paramecium pentaurelia TaxID=43138 RepID=A0A8S1XDT3_9CILI|nr:unnamed protein product [Paramecium pentaurelia]